MNKHKVPQKNTNSSKIKVIYIAGATRSGSTIVSNILGQIDGFFHAGEVIEAWDRGRTWKCSCGLFPDVCPIWSKIYRRLDLNFNHRDREKIIQLRDLHSRSYKLILSQNPFFKQNKREDSDKLLTSGLKQLYHGIQKETGATVIIDSSKNAGYGFILSKIDTIDLYLVHLVRDSRAVVFSWSKKKGGLWTEGPIKTAATWNSRNIAAEFIKKKLSGKYIKILYEDFMADPVGVTKQIIAPFNISSEKLPFISSHQVHLTTSHGLCGNPDRFSKGTIQLKVDNRWRNLQTRQKIIATALTWPLLHRYHYTL